MPSSWWKFNSLTVVLHVISNKHMDELFQKNTQKKVCQTIIKLFWERNVKFSSTCSLVSVIYVPSLAKGLTCKLICIIPSTKKTKTNVAGISLALLNIWIKHQCHYKKKKHTEFSFLFTILWYKVSFNKHIKNDGSPRTCLFTNGNLRSK